jgi:hypothetical protein
MSGGLEVGRLYKRASVRDDAQWVWAINGVIAAPDVMRSAGMAASFEEAQAQMNENWQKWLAWAKLQESGDSIHLAPAHPQEPAELQRGS